ncbi:MAG: helix-turn-helix transcriptional regulator [Rhodobacteraceae bacterium]|nr:helix-turn-helix transcriptional regulator [Paracoccaceae bacterium]
MHELPPIRAGTRVTTQQVSVSVRNCDESSYVPMHSHSRAQLLYASNGILQVTTEMGVWIVPANQAVWLPAGFSHEVMTQGAVSTHSLFFKQSQSDQLLCACSVVTISSLLRELILYASKEGGLDDTDADNRLIEVIFDQVKALPSAPLFLPVAEDPRLMKVMSALQADPADPRTLDDWANFAASSPRTLARLFLSQTGHTFGQWREKVRLLAALNGLAKGESVTSLAFDLGYQSQSAFIAMFKRSLGKTPGQFFKNAS